jgi:hypothetical protein
MDPDISHRLGVAAAVATVLSLVVAGASFVYDRVDNRQAGSAPAPASPRSGVTPTVPDRPPSSAQPAAEVFVKVHDVARWTMAAPRSSCGRTYADLDGALPAPRVNSDDEPGDELLYWQCSPVGLRRQQAAAMGRAGKTPPASATVCATTASQDAVAANLEPGDLDVRDDAFCIVTDEGNVAWLDLVAKEKTSNPFPNLVFRLVVWHRRPA